MSLERPIRNKLAGKRNADQEGECQGWIETVAGAKFPPGESYEDALKDGIILCNLMNKLKPGSIKKINTSGASFKMMENINNFQKAIQEYGVAEIDVFQTVDLWEQKDISQVTMTLYALGRETYRHPEWTGPWLGPKPSEENVRDFDDETIAAGKAVIGLQAGSNKGASQSGQNMGAGRKIIIGK